MGIWLDFTFRERVMVLGNDLQSRLGEGLSKVQGGIEQGKLKLQVLQDINMFKKAVGDASVRKSMLLIEMGQMTYGRLRSNDGPEEDRKVVTMAQEIVELDKKIYAASKRIRELSQPVSNGVSCPCGAVNGETDNFCGGCGKQIDRAPVLDESNMCICTSCDSSIPLEANFCPCCGSKAQ